MQHIDSAEIILSPDTRGNSTLLGRCLAPEGPDYVFGFPVYPERINYFLECLVEGLIIQVVILQVLQCSFGELDEAGR